VHNIYSKNVTKTNYKMGGLNKIPRGLIASLDQPPFYAYEGDRVMGFNPLIYCAPIASIPYPRFLRTPLITTIY